MKEESNREYIWTYEIGDRDQGKPTIVLVHGYGASGLIFYRIYKQLSEKYHVVLFDLPGMGRSSRPKFKCKTVEETEDFFMLSIERWREKMQLTNMVICAHSFGGYICGRYTFRYPEHVRKIVFISSLGIDRVPGDGQAAVATLMNKQP